MKLIQLTTILIFCCFLLQGQTIQNEVISSVGESSTTSSTSVSWTIGEPIIETGSNTTNILTQGFHQSYFIVTSIEENLSIIDFKLVLYPNPTAGMIQLYYSLGDEEELEYRFISINGKELDSGNLLRETELQLDLREYESALYFLNVYSKENQQLIKSYKVQKIN
jgi:hypothetical protein